MTNDSCSKPISPIKPGDLVQLSSNVRPYGWTSSSLKPEEIIDLDSVDYWFSISPFMYVDEIVEKINLKTIDNSNGQASVQAVLFDDRIFYILCSKTDLEKIIF